MSISAGLHGSTVGALFVGGTAGGAGGVTAVMTQLPHTGASSVLAAGAAGAFLVVAGVCTVTLAQRHRPSTTSG